ncbi:MAG: hypothetical protein C5B49_09965 [Bdellovibrio sp.]|nr:MAG: hypothetical protein C5B49_09965 [Bdellovibrio sp.]
MTTPIKVFKKGEVIFKEGDRITGLLVIQSGGVNLCIQRPKKNVDLFSLASAQVMGETFIAGMQSFNFSGIATMDTKIMEIPLEQVKSLLENGPQVTKVMVKSMAERLKTTMNEVRAQRLDKESVPCPDEQVAAIFAAVFHAANHKGLRDSKNPKAVSIDWILLKQYCQRMFGIIPKKVEQVLNMMVKFKLAKLVMGKPADDPEGPDEIQRITFSDLSPIENFADFWQYYYFKNGRNDLLRVDETLNTYLNTLVKLAEILIPDRLGVVKIELSKAIDFVKERLGTALTPDHFARLEARGVFAKRSLASDGTLWLHFEPKEFQNIANNWRFIREVDRWNEKGYVDPAEEKLAPRQVKPGDLACPQCSTAVSSNSKFCPECGFKLAQPA